MSEGRSKLLQASWSQIAAGYRDVLAPRFLPWAQDALAAFERARPPQSGIIWAPACGPGGELLMLAERMPENDIVGMDLAQGMVDLAAALVERQGLRCSPPASSSAAGIMSRAAQPPRCTTRRTHAAAACG